MSKNTICEICGGILRVEYVITFEQCTPREMRVEPSPFPQDARLCAGHDALAPKDTVSLLKEALSDGLHAEGAHHKQHALWRLAKILGLEHLFEDGEERGIA
jgi:hypothetical protein